MEWLNYHHLLYFWTVVQEGGASKAAAKLRLSQPTISAQVRLLERLLAELDEDKRTLLILSELEQWTLREIAEAFGSNPNTIHSRLHAAKKAFAEALARSLAGKEDLP